MQEIWKDIKGYEGLYQVSNNGLIKNKEGSILKPFISNGYYRVKLTKQGKRKNEYIHRIVAYAFLDLDKNKSLQVDHIDNNRLNNNFRNLQLLTQKENIKKQMQTMSKNLQNYKSNNVINIIENMKS